MNTIELGRALKQLRLSGISDVLDTRLVQAQAERMVHLDFLSVLVGHELTRRQDRLLAKRLKEAAFRDVARTLDTFDFDFNKKMNRKLLFELATARFVSQHEDALFLGPPGTGKSHLAQAIGSAVIQQATDGKNTAVESADLPITSLPASVRAAVQQPTLELIANLAGLRNDTGGAASGDAANRHFEKRALEAELRKREFTVRVDCHKLQDTGTAASPAEDEVSLTLSSGAVILSTSGETLVAGSGHAFTFSAGDFMPFDQAIQIAVNEQDRAGSRSRAKDDAIMEFGWEPPFVPHIGSPPTTVSTR